MRAAASLTLAAVLLAVGCLGGPTQNSPGPTPVADGSGPTRTPLPAGTIKVYAVDQAPEDGVVLERDDPRIRDVEPLRSALDDALESYGRVNRSTLASVRVEGEDLALVREALNSTPSYHDLPGHALGWADLFVRTDDTVFAVQLWVQV